MMSPQALVYIYFTLLSHAPEHICCHITQVCPSALVIYSTWTPYITANIGQTKQWTATLSCYKNFCQQQIWPSNANYMPHILCAEMRQPCQYIYLIGTWCYEQCDHDHWIPHAFHITSICPWTNMPATLLICVPLHFYCSLHTYPNSCTFPLKINKLHNIFTKLLKKCAINKYALQMSHAKITWCASIGGSMPICMSRKKTLQSKLWSVGRATDRQTDGLRLQKLIHQNS